jgi:hypothetical protein
LKSLSRSRRIRHKTQVRLRRKVERLPWLCLKWDGIFTSQRHCRLAGSARDCEGVAWCGSATAL